MNWLTQSRWRAVCTLTLAGAAMMAWYGADTSTWGGSRLAFAAYWGVFVLLLGVSLYIVLLDIRYIRLQYTLGKRDLLRQTLEDEGFRRAITEAQKGKSSEGEG